MVKLTFRILSGADRGQVHVRRTPLTIGRESGNGIQLNDLLVSRCHLKIQEDNGVVLLADCDSTNGTRVNGEPVRQWILRPGDLISLGNTTMLVGTRAEIVSRLLGSPWKQDVQERGAATNTDYAAQNTWNLAHEQLGAELQQSDSEEFSPSELFSEELSGKRALLQEKLSDQQFFSMLLSKESVHRELFQSRPPCLPTGLSPFQTAQMSELLQYFYLKLRNFQTSALEAHLLSPLMNSIGVAPSSFDRNHRVSGTQECREHAREVSVTSETHETSPILSQLASSLASSIPQSPAVPQPNSIPSNNQAIPNAIVPTYEPNQAQPLSISTESSASIPPHPYFALQWQNILDVEAQLAVYLRQMEQPNESDE